MSDKESRSFTSESVKIIAESSGIGNLPDDAITELSADCTYRIKQTIQEAVKFMHHAKRSRLTTADIDQALRCENVEPLYGFHTPNLVPFRFASGGGRELHFTEDKDLDLSDLVTASLPRVPPEISIKPHWMCVDGQQPATPDNPPPVSKDAQKQQILDAETKTTESAKPRTEKQRHKAKGAELVKMKDIAMHELSVEQQLFYKEITEACVGSNELRRSEALQSLATDPGLHQMLPRFSTFVSEGVKINVVQFNLAILIYLMRMVKAIMDNPTLYLEKYLHELIPGVLTCIVSKQLCMRPDIDNHWALRDFAARLMGLLCKNFSSCVNNTQARVTKTFSAALQGDKTALATQYGAIGGLGELGNEVVKTFLMPHVRSLSTRIQQITEGPIYSNNDKISADHIKKSVVKYVSAVILKSSRPPGDSVDNYIRDFGYLGPILHTAVFREHQIVAGNSMRQSVGLQSRPGPLILTSQGSSISQPMTLSHKSRPGPLILTSQGSSISQPMTPLTQGQGQKYVFLSQGRARPTTPTSQTVMKIITPGPGQSNAPINPSQNNKIVVMPMQKSTTSVSGTNTVSASTLANLPNVKVIKSEPNGGVTISRMTVGSSTTQGDGNSQHGQFTQNME